MEKGGFLPKKLVNIFRKAKHRMRPIQRGISNISKGNSVSKSDINTETSYIIAVTYKSGTKRVYNDVKIREYKKCPKSEILIVQSNFSVVVTI